MGALPPVTPWIPEDDLLLKTSVEAGASLESLAKGAVEFSRRFTLRELRDRWHSLLYDPVISEEASARMIEFQRSNSIGNSKEKKSAYGKRKDQSIHRCHSALRKRICSEPFNSIDPGFAPGDINFVGNQNYMLEDPILNQFELPDTNFDMIQHAFPPMESVGGTNHAYLEENLPVVNEMGPPEEIPGSSLFETNGFGECGPPFQLEYSSPLPELPEWPLIEDIVDPHIPDGVGLHENDQNIVDPFSFPDDGDAADILSDSEFNNLLPCGELKSSTASPEGYLEELSNALFNFTNEEELLVMDVDGQDVINNSYFDGLSSLLLNSSKEFEGDQRVTEPIPIAADMASPRELGDNGGSQHTNGFVVCDSEAQTLSSKSVSNPEFPEMRDGVIFCSLNTEDPAIPCNDDIDFIGYKHISERDPQIEKKEQNNTRQSLDVSSPVVRPRPPQITGPTHQIYELPKGDPRHNESEEPIETEPAKFIANPSLGSDSFNANPQKSVCGKLDIDAATSIQSHQALHVDFDVPEPVVNPSASDEEEQYSGSDDDDIPYFSDVEALILDMDLAPDSSDAYSRREVSRYQSESAKKTIIRLEQGARSYMQRAIASHGAFAVFYGRHIKHYIKKSEVTLGRSTEVFKVDIDLRIEGRPNSISRRQAIIKMDKNGSFLLQNLGKCSIFVNSNEVAPRQVLTLTSNCLLQIREMSFIFETNQTCVRKYLHKIKNEQHVGKGVKV